MSRPKKIVRTKRIYKKRSKNKKAANAVFFIILIIVLIGLGYIVMSEWSKRFGPNAPVPPSSVYTPQTSSGSSSDSQTSSDVSSEITKPLPTQIQDIKAISMSYTEYEGKSAEQVKAFVDTAKTQGYNAIYVELKSEDGKIHFATKNQMAASYSAISETATTIDIAQIIKEAGLTPIARMSSLKDKTAPHVSRENSYAFSTSLNVNWLDDSVDRGGKAWLNPYMDNTRKYIADLTQEVCGLGYEAVVLENVMFPDKNTNKMNPINENKPRAEILAQLLNEAQTAAGDIPVLYGFDAATTARLSENVYSNYFIGNDFKQFAPVINLDAIMARRGEIVTKLDVSGGGATIDTDIAKLLLKQCKINDEVLITPIIRKADLDKMLPVLSELDIKNYIII